ncbi:MAG: exo-beta-N-acetylmuramidase NamZ family protein [Myxococcaceae bacterium]
MRIRTGLDVWEAEQFRALRGLKVGAIVNPTSVDGRLRHLADLLWAAPGVTLAALFGPEHGVRGEVQYMEAVGDARDPRTGVPMHSLYGSTADSLRPRAEWLQGLDVVVFDIQDVGARYYTYVYTLALAMEACGKAGVRLVVLDRPNPLGGERVEGNLVEPGFQSFVGLYPLPNRHGMTLGELARMLNAEQRFGCDLAVVPCLGWSRRMRWTETGLPFIPPSPNMPTPDTAQVYPGMCLLEGTNISEGRGTCRPFEQFGAPYLDAHAVAEALERHALPGLRLRPVHFVPTWDKHRGADCGGAFLHVTDPAVFPSVKAGLAVVAQARRLGGDAFQWRAEAYEFVTDVPAFDLLCGNGRVRGALEDGADFEEVAALLDGAESAFLERRAPHLLYG